MNIPCRKAFSETILKEAVHNTNIIVLCTDSRGSVTLDEFYQKLPKQFVEIGIAEQNCVGVAAGLANAGFIPFACGPASFYSMRSAEQIKVDLAYSQANVKIIGISGGVSYGALGATHHSLQDIALMNAIPDMKIILPADEMQTRKLTKALISDTGPVYVRMGRGAVPDIYSEKDTFEIGKANLLEEGRDIGIIATGEMVYAGKLAVDLLKSKGVMAVLVDMHTIKPLDTDMLDYVRTYCSELITIEEHSINGGLGSIVASYFSEDSKVRIHKMALPDRTVVTGNSKEIFQHYGLTGEHIANQALKLLEGKEKI